MRLTRTALPFALGLAAAPFLPLLPVFDGASPQEHDLVRSFSETVQRVAREVAPAVVSVETLTEVRNRDRRLVTSQGSGVILSADGIVVTNHHVAGNGDRITVRLDDGRELRARLRGTDPETDLAVLQIDAKNLVHLDLRTDQPPVGEYVLAVGNPLGLDHTVTSGIISASGRRIGVATYENFLQTDAAINPGNSGGPLIDLEGRVVGINTALEVSERGSQGLGFAIPADMVREVFDEILEKGRVERGFLGISVQTLTPEISDRLGLAESSHVRISDVPAGPAREAGVQAGDILLAIDGVSIRESYEVLETVARIDPGSRVRLKLWRDGERLTVMVRAAERRQTSER